VCVAFWWCGGLSVHYCGGGGVIVCICYCGGVMGYVCVSYCGGVGGCACSVHVMVRWVVCAI
jgi:hypothetical protein